MLGTDRNDVARRLFADLPRHYETLAQALSLGQYRSWRRALVDKVVPDRPQRVLDVASGTAGVAIALAERTPASITGIDISEAMLSQGGRAVADRGLGRRIVLVPGRAEALPFADGSFDALTFTFLLRYVEDPAATLTEMARVLRSGAVMASLEFFVPPRRIWRGLWWLYTRCGLPVAGVVGGRPWVDVGRFLGPSISQHYRAHPLPSIVAAWHAAGMTDVQYELHSLGGAVVMWGRRAGG